jgi:hypothetical protein
MEILVFRSRDSIHKNIDNKNILSIIGLRNNTFNKINVIEK